MSSRPSPTRRSLLLAAAATVPFGALTALAAPAQAAPAVGLVAKVAGAVLGTTVLDRTVTDVQISSLRPLQWVKAYTSSGTLGSARSLTASPDGRYRTTFRMDLAQVPDQTRLVIGWKTDTGATGTRLVQLRTRAVAPAGVPVTRWGAVGDGVTDDTVALQAAFDAATPGTRLLLPAGSSFRHTGILRLRRDGVTLTGGGTLLATDERTSAVVVTGNGVTLSDVAFAVRGTTQRWGTWDQMALCVLGAADFTARGVTVDGSAAAGVYLWGATNFTLDRVAVAGSRADGIHITGPSRDGVVTDPVVTSSGDDGVAVVSYLQDGAPVARVRIDRPRVLGTTWGRGVSVVGGQDITVTDLAVDSSSAAGLYIAQEGEPWNTFAPVRVTVTGGTITNANHTQSVDHGAVLVLAGRAGDGPTDVTVSRVAISGTRQSASRQVGLLSTAGAAPARVELSSVTVAGGPANVLQTQFSDQTWRTRSWSVSGARPVPDHVGW